jgi:hypothetical protein
MEDCMGRTLFPSTILIDMFPMLAAYRIVVVAPLAIALVATCSAQIDATNWGTNTSGVKLILHEGPRQKSAQGTTLWYNLVGEGFASDVPFELWQWVPEKEPKRVMEGVSFDKRGLLVCSGRPGFCQGDGPNDPINIKTTAAQGEPKRMAVVSLDGKIAGFAEAVPFPIEASDKNCKLSVVRMGASAEAVTVRLAGFLPSERLALTTLTNMAEAAIDESADKQGSWTGVVKLPSKGQGKASISVAPVIGHSCKVAVSFDWGAGSNHPM